MNLTLQFGNECDICIVYDFKSNILLLAGCDFALSHHHIPTVESVIAQLKKRKIK